MPSQPTTTTREPGGTNRSAALPTPGRRLPRTAVLVLLVTAALLAYSPVFSAGTIWDDDQYLTENPQIATVRGLVNIWFQLGATPQYYPLVFTTFWVEHALWGFHPLGYHVVNILLHAGGAFLFWLVLRRLSVPGALLAALIFALHPVHVESVAWISERKNVLSGFLFFAALLAWLRSHPPDEGQAAAPTRWKPYVLSLVFFGLALLSKTVTCSLPVVILGLTWWKRRRIPRRTALALLPFFLLGAGMGLLTVWMEKQHVLAKGAEFDFTWIDRFLIAGRALWFYAFKLLWPLDLAFNYPRWDIDAATWWQYLFPAAFVVAVGGLWMARRAWGSGALAAVALFAVMLFPALGFINVYPMRFSFVADHFQYLPSTALIALFAALACRLPWRRLPRLRAVPPALAAGLCLILGLLTWRQGTIYRDEETLWRETLAVNPNSFIAYHNLGVLHYKRRAYEPAVQCFLAALRINPRNARSHFNLGVLYRAKGAYDQSANHLAEVVRLNPEDADAHRALSMTLMRLGQAGRAETHLRESLRLNPRSAGAHLDLGVLLGLKNDLEGAARHLTEAVRLDPLCPEAHYNLGLARVRSNDIQGAIEPYRAFLALRPDDAFAHEELGILLARLQRRQEAEGHFRKAMAILEASGRQGEAARIRAEMKQHLNGRS